MWELEEGASFHQLSQMTIIFFHNLQKTVDWAGCQNSKLGSFTLILVSGRFNYLGFCSEMSFKRFEVNQILKGSVSCSVMSGSLQPHGLQPTTVLCPWVLQARNLEWVGIPFSREPSQPRVRTWVSCIAADSLPSEPLGKLLIVPPDKQCSERGMVEPSHEVNSPLQNLKR